jgi:hypothetical protein
MPLFLGKAGLGAGKEPVRRFVRKALCVGVPGCCEYQRAGPRCGPTMIARLQVLRTRSQCFYQVLFLQRRAQNPGLCTHQ